ncbi:MAG TPA: hypothetical protein DDZ83_11045 [Nitrospinae bacterium]|nr:hypothetical protein [Nitrospinota bacterium]
MNQKSFSFVNTLGHFPDNSLLRIGRKTLYLFNCRQIFEKWGFWRFWASKRTKIPSFECAGKFLYA